MTCVLNYYLVVGLLSSFVLWTVPVKKLEAAHVHIDEASIAENIGWKKCDRNIVQLGLFQ